MRSRGKSRVSQQGPWLGKKNKQASTENEASEVDKLGGGTEGGQPGREGEPMRAWCPI